MEKDSIKNTEERQHYRIDDEMEVSYHLLPKNKYMVTVDEQLIQQTLFTDQNAYQHFQLMKNFAQIDEEMKNLLRDIKHSNNNVAESLQLSQKKITLLSNCLFNASERRKQMVNLSGGGAAFQTDKEIKNGSLLLLKLILGSSLYGFICTAKVVLCRHLTKRDPERPYRISVEFIDLDKNDEQTLQRHIMQHQAQSAAHRRSI